MRVGLPWSQNRWWKRGMTAGVPVDHQWWWLRTKEILIVMWRLFRKGMMKVEVKACSFASWDRVLPISHNEHHSCPRGQPVSFWISLSFSFSVIIIFIVLVVAFPKSKYIRQYYFNLVLYVSQQLDQEGSFQCTAPSQAGRSKPERNNVPDYNLRCCLQSISGSIL